MLKIDNKYVNKYIGSEIPSISVITPCKTCRTYVFSNNRMLCVETKGSEGAFEKVFLKFLTNIMLNMKSMRIVSIMFM